MCSVLLAYVVAHAAIVVMLIIPVHTVVIAIVSDVVLANADTHDILGTDHVVHADAYVVVVTAHAGTVTG